MQYYVLRKVLLSEYFLNLFCLYMLDEIPYAITEPIFQVGIVDCHDRMEILDLWSKLDILVNAIFFSKSTQ